MFNFFNKPKIPKFSGLLPDPPDDRDIPLSAVQDPVEIPAEFKRDLTNIPIDNQKSHPSCFPSKTLILMENLDWKPISKIKIGEFVITHKGRKKKVIQTFKRQWQGKMVKINIVGDYQSLVSTPEHPYLVIEKIIKSRPKKYKNPKWENAKVLKDGDFIALLSNPNYSKEPSIFEYEKDPEFLWLFGLYLAEGSIHKEREVCFSLNISETKIAQRAEKILKEYGITARLNLKEESNSMMVSFNDKYFANAFREFGCGAENKIIPQRFMLFSPLLQYKLFEGWFIGDGSFKGKEKVGASISEILIKQIRLILFRNKVFSRIRKRKIREDRKDVWELYITNKGKTERGFWHEGYYWAKIRKVNKTPFFTGGYVYNIEVEDDNSYVVNYSIVHNCCGYAASKVKESQELYEHKRFIDISPRFIYALCKKFDGYNGAGTYIRQAMKTLQKFGACEEKSFPSDTSLSYKEFINCDLITPEIYKEAEKYKIETYASVPPNWEQLKQAIYQNKVVLSGMAGTRNGWSQLPLKPPKEGEKLFGHSVAFHGFDENYIYFINSWGKYWQGHGIGHFSKDMLPYLNSTWTSVDITEPMEPLEGYVASQYLQEIVEFKVGDKAKTTDNLNLRESPNGKKINLLKKGRECVITSEGVKNGNYVWNKIRTV